MESFCQDGSEKKIEFRNDRSKKQLKTLKNLNLTFEK